MMQFDIDFSGKLDAATKIGMAAADSHANELWRRVCDAAILAVARRLPEFTVDDVLDELASIPNAPSTHNLSALGPRMKRVARELGHMVATDRMKRSRHPQKHGNVHRIWVSKVYQGGTSDHTKY